MRGLARLTGVPTVSLLGSFARDHRWAQRHLSHYVEGDLPDARRRRLDRHAAECPDCARGVRAMLALVRGFAALRGRPATLPTGVLQRFRAEADRTPPPP